MWKYSQIVRLNRICRSSMRREASGSLRALSVFSHVGPIGFPFCGKCGVCGPRDNNDDVSGHISDQVRNFSWAPCVKKEITRYMSRNAALIREVCDVEQSKALGPPLLTKTYLGLSCNRH